MSISNNNDLNILDLPNEILLKIFNKLTMTDVLYSLVNATQRFDQLVLDPLYIRKLDMTSMTMKSFHDRIYSIDDLVLDKICKNVLPRINHQVHELIVEQHSMKRSSYYRIFSTSLVITRRFSRRSDATLRKLLSEQITHLKIDLNDKTPPLPETLSMIFALILSLCNQIVEVNFCYFFHRSMICTFELSSTDCVSSTLTSLKINVKTFDDCLYLLDGRLGYLLTLFIDVKEIVYTLGAVDNTKKIPKLKNFSLRSFPRTYFYDDLIIPLLRRMINLEELILNLSIIRVDSNYIDGLQLYDDILIYMPRLNKFIFSIDTSVVEKNIKIALSSNEDIQRSFIRREYGPVGSHVDIFSRENGCRGHMYSLPYEFKSRCHIYSLPYQFKNYSYLNNDFQGGVFDNVQYLMMTDFRPFERNFFKIISQSFPLLQHLYIFNDEPQKDKQQSTTFITFSHLIYLYLDCAHVDYAEQFLSDKQCHLPCLLNLSISYESLAMATNNFTNDATRLTSSKLTSLRLKGPFVTPENFHLYFPSL
ncbi:unnamed protein product [Rotaria magnacalcarata]|uniref:F-box domain-containing protein n=1 Tax=Rotaria magnacalcarata TaxID=392030 RepID=A0A816ZU98_9BILA|nr:unnamed protein product [Rotaria magnacalcarata]CAF3858384.1 unnamed protein product [Rotaria magnacalcarata]